MDCAESEAPFAQTLPTINTCRPKDETPEEKRARKQEVKEQKRLRREEKKANQLAFKQEAKEIAMQRRNHGGKVRPIT